MEGSYHHGLYLQAMCVLSPKYKRVGSTHFCFAFKLRECHGSGLPLSCMNYVGLKPTNMMIFIENKPSLKKQSLRSLPKRLGFGTFFVALQFGLSTMIGCSTINNGTNPRLNTLNWDDLIMFTKVAWKRVISFVKISTYSAKALLKGLTKLGVLGTPFVGEAVWRLTCLELCCPSPLHLCIQINVMG